MRQIWAMVTIKLFFGCVSSPNIHFAGAEVCLAVTFDVLVHYIKLSSNRVKVLGVNRDWNVIWRPVPLKQRLRVNWRPVHSKLKDYISGCNDFSLNSQSVSFLQAYLLLELISSALLAGGPAPDRRTGGKCPLVLSSNRVSRCNNYVFVVLGC